MLLNNLPPLEVMEKVSTDLNLKSPPEASTFHPVGVLTASLKNPPTFLCYQSPDLSFTVRVYFSPILKQYLVWYPVCFCKHQSYWQMEMKQSMHLNSCLVSMKCLLETYRLGS